MTNPPLTTLGVKIRAHLKEHRPKLAKELEKAGTLDQTSASLQDQADVAYDGRSLESRRLRRSGR